MKYMQCLQLCATAEGRNRYSQKKGVGDDVFASDRQVPAGLLCMEAENMKETRLVHDKAEALHWPRWEAGRVSS